MSSDKQSQASFEQAGLAGVLKQNQLCVQPNQRHYSWKAPYVEKLFKDLSKAIADNDKSYFLGTIVTIPHTDGTLEVVDGQQRLATTAILLAAIRDYLDGKEPVIVESINNEFLTGIDRAKRERLPRIRLNVDDNDLFATIVSRNASAAQPNPNKLSHELMRGAYDLAVKHVKNIVSTLEPTNHGDMLNTWLSFLENQAIVILVKVPDGSNAYKMFETLNDRGLKTTQADLIKNHLYGRSGGRFQEVQTRWSYMKSHLESMDEEDNTVTFLRYALIGIHGFLRESEVFDTIVENVKSEQTAVTTATSLENAAATYATIFNSSHEKWNKYPEAARRSIEVLSMFDIKPLRPLLMAVASKMDLAEGAKSLQFLVALSVRLIITASTRTGSVEELIGTIAHAVYRGEVATCKDLKTRLSKITPSDKEFEVEFATARVSKAQLARYYLRSLEMAAKGEEAPWFIPQNDQTVVNLEHILPKKPEGHWNQAFTPDEVSIYVNRLGNQCLMLASQNSQLRSAEWWDKKEVYAQSPFILTSQLAPLPNWWSDAVVERQKTMAELAVKAWPV